MAFIMLAGELAQVEQLEKAYLEVSSDLGLLSEILDWFDQFNHAPLPNDVWLQCQLALAEGFTNAVRHAHRYKPRHTPIKIEVVLQKDAIELKIWDHGYIFDLSNALAQLPSDANLTSEGGRGIKLLHQVADRLYYTRHANGQNCLTIIKYFLC